LGRLLSPAAHFLFPHSPAQSIHLGTSRAGVSLPGGPMRQSALPRCWCDRIFCILVLHRKKIHVWTLKNFNVIFGPFTRRRSLWRRGNTARRHSLWRRGTCCVGTNGRRGADVVPSSAPLIMAPSSILYRKLV
jgi:hypothetical protein